MPVVDDERERTFRAVAIAACRDLGVLIHDIGVVADHVHLAVSIPPKHAVSDVVQRLKGSSSRALGEDDRKPENPWVGWQSEYGVLTFGERSLPEVAKYVRDQMDHHADGTLIPAFERIDRERAH
jgi:putative transposase